MSFYVTTDLVKNESGVFPLTNLEAGETATILFSAGDEITPEQIEEFDVAEYACAKEFVPVEVKAVYHSVENELHFNGNIYAVKVEAKVKVEEKTEAKATEKPSK